MTDDQIGCDQTLVKRHLVVEEVSPDSDRSALPRCWCRCGPLRLECATSDLQQNGPIAAISQNPQTVFGGDCADQRVEFGRPDSNENSSRARAATLHTNRAQFSFSTRSASLPAGTSSPSRPNSSIPCADSPVGFGVNLKTKQQQIPNYTCQNGTQPLRLHRRRRLQTSDHFCCVL